MSNDNAPAPLDMPTLKQVFVEAFPGCAPDLSKGIGVSSHCVEITFFEYHLRAVMSRINKTDGLRKMQVRLLQRVKDAKGRTTKVLLVDMHSTDPAEVIQAIKDSRALLAGTIHAISRALNPPPDKKVRSVDDLLRGGE